MYYKYTGDPTGTNLCSGHTYERVWVSYADPGIIHLEDLDNDRQLVKITRDEFEYHKENNNLIS